MALQLTQTENGTPRYIINNWQEGIADSPELGFSNMRNVEIGAIQGEVMPSFKSTSYTQSTKTSISYTVSVANPGVFTSAGHGLANNAAITFTNSGGAFPTGISSTGAYNAGTAYAIGDTMEANGQIWVAIAAGTGNAYTNIAYWREACFYVVYISTDTFSITRFISGSTSIQITGAGSGTNTYSTVVMGVPKNIVSLYQSPPSPPLVYYSQNNSTFMQDDNGRVWFQSNNGGLFAPVLGNYTDHINTSPGSGNGLTLWTGSDSNIWLFACWGSRVDILNVTSFLINFPTTFPPWTVNNTNFTFTNTTFSTPHNACVSVQDNRIYFTDGQVVTSFIEIATKVFSPTDATTYSFGTAVTLLKGTYAGSIAELSTNLIVGDYSSNRLFIWDRNSTNYNAVWRCAEDGIFNMININNTLYILAGNKGVIYSTQGYTINEFKKIPEYLTGGSVVWGGLSKINGHLLVGISGIDAVLTRYNSGVYKIYLHTLQKGTLVCDNTASDGLTTTYITALWSISSDTYFMGTCPASGSYLTGGMDYVSPNNFRCTDGSSYIETQLLSVSDVQETRNFQLIGLELGRTLATGESVTVTWRETPKESYTSLATFSFSSDGAIVNDYKPASISDINALQLKIAISSNSSTITQTPRLKTIVVQ